MKYIDFTISNYKAIKSNLIVDVNKNSLIPIIGVNESGKTSVLWAIFCFDKHNDRLNDGRHLLNAGNLSETTSRSVPFITARIKITLDELLEIIDYLEIPQISVTQQDGSQINIDDENFTNELNLIKQNIRTSQWDGIINIKRNIQTLEYTFEDTIFSAVNVSKDLLLDALLACTPYILYFDDFRDTVDEKIEIVKEEQSGWLQIMQQLFTKTESEYSVFDLSSEDDLIRQSILSDVSANLNKTLSKEWKKFTLDKGSKLNVCVEYTQEDGREFLKLRITEKIGGKDRYFGIRDRSKGFYWFFNFVMKLEFNPKKRSSYDRDTIYLLDEPGSYLHSSAQEKLCEKLVRLSRSNKVIYCTHSHHLLNPEIIPLNSIKIAQKGSSGRIDLINFSEYKNPKSTKRLAIQPIIDALQIKPFLMNLDYNKICITEGIYDYYTFEMYKEIQQNIDVKFMPSTGADSIKYFISIAIAWQLNYVALWDKDIEGITHLRKAEKFFGANQAKRFLTLQLGSKEKVILQDLFDGKDLAYFSDELKAPKDSSFESIISLLFFNPQRNIILRNAPGKTKNNIENINKAIMNILK